MRTFLLRGLAVVALLVPASVVTAAPVAAAPLAATGACATGIGNAGGQGIICDITIVNTITGTGGSATVTVHECLGSAGDPTDGAGGHACTTTTTTASAPITAVTQCDGSANGGGGTLRCTVTITNNFVGVTPGSGAVTVNQCVGSGDGLTTGCDPFPATTSGAAITQCNGSANGGTLVQLTCTASGTMASALVVTINQCNGSALGGGGLVICTAAMVNNAVTSSPSPGTTAPPTSAAGNAPIDGSTPAFPLMIVSGLSGLILAAIWAQRRFARI
jgi:hypothetical protein